MRSVLEERKPSAHEEDMAELEDIAPYKLQKEELFPKTKKFRKMRTTTLTLEETQALIAASNAPVTNSLLKREDSEYHDTYDIDDVRALLEGRTDLTKR